MDKWKLALMIVSIVLFIGVLISLFLLLQNHMVITKANQFGTVVNGYQKYDCNWCLCQLNNCYCTLKNCNI